MKKFKILNNLKIPLFIHKGNMYRKISFNYSFLNKNFGKKRLKIFLYKNGFSNKNSLIPISLKKKNFSIQNSKSFFFYFFLYNIYLKQKHRGIEGALMSVTREILLNTYRGRRHKIGLPVHGQRTRSNRRTARFLRIFGYFLDVSFLNNYKSLNFLKFKNKWRFEQKIIKKSSKTFVSF